MSGWDQRYDIEELQHDLDNPDPIGAFRALVIAVPLGAAMWAAAIWWVFR